MSQCTRCGATFHCAMADASSVDASSAAAADPPAACWCTALPALLPVPQAGAAGCWCPDCLRAEIAAQQKQRPADLI